MEVINKKLGERHYNGNPIVYFRKNFKIYSGLNRSRLSLLDSGLYRALSRAGQLEQAIPQVNELAAGLCRKLGKGEFDLSKEDIEIIIESYKKYDGNASRASKNLPYSLSTILRYWRNSGLQIKGNNKLSEKQVKEIIVSYKTYGGNVLRASKYLLYSVSTIWRYWKSAGLEVQKRGRPRYI